MACAPMPVWIPVVTARLDGASERRGKDSPERERCGEGCLTGTGMLSGGTQPTPAQSGGPPGERSPVLTLFLLLVS